MPQRLLFLGGPVCLLAALGLAVQPVRAAEYRLQVTNLDYLTFSNYLETSAPPWRGEEYMGGLEARLDRQEFPTAAVIPGREVQLLEEPGYGGKPPARLAVLPATRQQAWTTLVWEGNPEDAVAFVVKTEMVAWQEVRAVATNAEGVLRRLSIGGPALFGRRWQQVPEVSYDYIAHAVDRKTFPRWVAQHAKAINGMAVVVARGRHAFYHPDRVYAMITLPPEPRTFKLVIGWRDRDDRGTNGSRDMR
jgi:hypothetical protein